jgi:hypothetical protein
MRRFTLLFLFLASTAIAADSIILLSPISLPNTVANTVYYQSLAKAAAVKLNGGPCNGCVYRLESPIQGNKLTLAPDGTISGKPGIAGPVSFVYSVTAPSGAKARGRVDVKAAAVTTKPIVPAKPASH